MWPGRVKSSDLEMGEARARAVVLRSYAEIPVDVPGGSGRRQCLE